MSKAAVFLAQLFCRVHYICNIGPQGANPPLRGTPEKLRFSVPSGLRPPVAPELARQAS